MPSLYREAIVSVTSDGSGIPAGGLSISEGEGGLRGCSTWQMRSSSVWGKEVTSSSLPSQFTAGVRTVQCVTLPLFFHSHSSAIILLTLFRDNMQ